MVRLEFSLALDYQIDAPGCDFIFSIHAAQTPHQSVVCESLEISQGLPPNLYTDFAATVDYGADLILGPTDFHACVEVYLSDRWYLFTPSGVAIPNPQGMLAVPQLVAQALSTDGQSRPC